MADKNKTITIYVVALVQRKVGRLFKTGPMLLSFEATETPRSVKVNGRHAALGYKQIFAKCDVCTTSAGAIGTWRAQCDAEVDICERKLAEANAARHAVIDTSDPGYAQRKSRS